MDVVGSAEEEGGTWLFVLLEEGRPGEREGAWVLVDAEADADAEADILDAWRSCLCVICVIRL